jgi:hypothetical protein
LGRHLDVRVINVGVIQIEINIFSFAQAIEKVEVRTLALHLQLDGLKALLGPLLYLIF